MFNRSIVLIHDLGEDSNVTGIAIDTQARVLLIASPNKEALTSYKLVKTLYLAREELIEAVQLGLENDDPLFKEKLREDTDSKESLSLYADFWGCNSRLSLEYSEENC